MSDLITYWPLILLFFGVAFLYSSVGFGGGSSYLAILALWGIGFESLRLISLLCNITVVSGGSFRYYKRGHLDFKQVFPLVASSIPMAYLGGRFALSEVSFFMLLGVTLLIASFLIWFKPQQAPNTIFKKNGIILLVIIGGGIGFLSGLVGIGGGIFLSPVLYLLRWAEPKKIAAAASFFILVNSVSGLAGQMQHFGAATNWNLPLALILSVAVGGTLGSYLGTEKLPQMVVRRATAVLIAYVAVSILIKYV